MYRTNILYPVSWTMISMLVLVLDYLSGPGIHFPIVYALPVFLASRFGSVRWGIILSFVLPLLRVVFNVFWGEQENIFAEFVNTFIRISVLSGLALAVGRITRLNREVRMLRGILPVCSFCKKIRTESGEWEQMEAFISARSEAAFTHGFCPECANKHYGRYLMKQEASEETIDAKKHEKSADMKRGVI